MTKKHIELLKKWLEHNEYKQVERKIWHVGRSNQYLITVQKDKEYYRCLVYLLDENDINVEVLQIVCTGRYIG